MTIKLTCDVCGKEIVGVENFVNAGDKVVCSDKCKQEAVSKFMIENNLTKEQQSGMMFGYKERLYRNKGV